MIRRNGHMRHFVRFVRRVDSLDDRGQTTQEITVAENIPVSIMPISGREIELSRQLVPTADVTIECRGPCEATAADTVVTCDGRRYTLGYVEDVDGNGLHYRMIGTQEAR